jgi:hypothetical protein
MGILITLYGQEFKIWQIEINDIITAFVSRLLTYILKLTLLADSTEWMSSIMYCLDISKTDISMLLSVKSNEWLILIKIK